MISDEAAMHVADAVARYALCRRSRVGAILVRDGAVVAKAVNGVADGPSCTNDGCPRGMRSFDELPAGSPAAGAGKCVGVHAEAHVIAKAARAGIPTAGATLYVTKTPCRSCRVLIGLAGIAAVVSP